MIHQFTGDGVACNRLQLQPLARDLAALTPQLSALLGGKTPDKVLELRVARVVPMKLQTESLRKARTCCHSARCSRRHEQKMRAGKPEPVDHLFEPVGKSRVKALYWYAQLGG